MSNKISKSIADELIVATIGIFLIFILEMFALSKGFDGYMFGLATAGIGSIIGWIFRTVYKRK